MNMTVLWSWIQNDAVAPFAFAKQETQQTAWCVSIKDKAAYQLNTKLCEISACGSPAKEPTAEEKKVTVAEHASIQEHPTQNAGYNS